MKTLTALDLAQFTGSESFFKHGLVSGFLFTEGVRHVAEAGGAYWLIDEIATNQHRDVVKAEEFQSWTLKREPDGNGATLTCGDGNGNCVYRQAIEFTDFSLPEIEMWAVKNEFGGRTVMLPREY